VGFACLVAALAITGKAESFKLLLHSKASPKLNFSERALKTVDATALQNAGVYAASSDVENLPSLNSHGACSR